MGLHFTGALDRAEAAYLAAEAAFRRAGVFQDSCAANLAVLDIDRGRPERARERLEPMLERRLADGVGAGVAALAANLLPCVAPGDPAAFDRALALAVHWLERTGAAQPGSARMARLAAERWVAAGDPGRAAAATALADATDARLLDAP
jgi:hypothetical protein